MAHAADQGFEAGGIAGGLADSDEEDAGESGSVSVAGPEKTELAVERAGDWVRFLCLCLRGSAMSALSQLLPAC